MSLKLRGGNRITTARNGGLTAMGITQNQSTRWQRLARIPDCVLDDFVDFAAVNRIEMTTAGFTRYANAKVDSRTRQHRNSLNMNSRAVAVTIDEMRDQLRIVSEAVFDICKRDELDLNHFECRELPRYIAELLDSLAALENGALAASRRACLAGQRQVLCVDLSMAGLLAERI